MTRQATKRSQFPARPAQTPREQTSDNLPVLAPPRLPWHPAIEERFNISKSDWKALTEAIFPSAQSTESVVLALSYCKARHLDPFKRCIHIVGIWDKQKHAYVDTVWPGIGELRTTAHRTKLYAGRDKTQFGPIVKKTWQANDKERGHYEVTVEYPEWAQVTVYRMVGNERVAYNGPQVYWLETFGADRNDVPNSMWQRRPIGQIDKCAEAASLRAAFPEELGNEYTSDEAHLPWAKHVESHEVKKPEHGNEAVKKLLAEGDKQQELADKLANEPPPETVEDADRRFKTGESPEAQPEPTDDPEISTEERDAETDARIQEEKRKLGLPVNNTGQGQQQPVTSGQGKKSNLF